MKILFLLDELPPTKSANGICAEKVMRALLADGCSVFCICWKANGNKEFSVCEIPEKPWNRKVKRWKERDSAYSRVSFQIARYLYRIKRYFLLPLWPADSLTTARDFYHAAQRIIDKENVTTVVAVNYPGETLLAMKWLKKKYKSKIKCVMYPLDVTLCGVPYGEKLEKMISRKLNRSFMRSCFKVADAMLVLENAQQLYESIFQDQQNKFILCGIPLLEKVIQSTVLLETASLELHCVYTGNLIKNLRDPKEILDLLSKVVLLNGRKIIFDLYGQMDKGLSDEIGSTHYPFEFIVHNWVSEAELVGILGQADVLLNIGNREEQLIPSKLFTYMSTGKPILHQCLIENDPCIPYLKKYDNAYVVRVEGTCREEQVQQASLFLGNLQDKKTDVTKLFPRCTPQYTAQRLKEI